VFQNPLVAIFKVYDEESCKECFMHLPTIVHTITNDHDYQQYVARLHDWVRVSHHPTILQGFFLKQIFDKNTFMFTQRIDLLTIKEWIETSYNNQVEEDLNNQILSFTFQIASGMAYLHQNEIVHGDLRP